MATLDMDNIISGILEMPISKIFSKLGEGHFRHLEYELCQGLDSLENTVIATGGGIVLDERNITALRRYATIFYLKASPQKLAANLEGDETRPLLPQDGRLAAITTLLAQREHLYQAASDFIVETDALNPVKIAQMVAKLYEV